MGAVALEWGDLRRDAPLPALAGRVSLGMLGVRYFQRDIQFSRLQLYSVPEKMLFLQLWPTHFTCLSMIRVSNVEALRKILYFESESLQVPSLMVSLEE